jgi:hypothetical protein
MSEVLDRRLRVVEVMVAGFAVAFGIAAMRLPGYMSSCATIGSFRPHRGWMNGLRYSSLVCAIGTIVLATWRSVRTAPDGEHYEGDGSDLWMNLGVGAAVGVAVAALLVMGVGGCY